jgi:hypothetical protein
MNLLIALALIIGGSSNTTNKTSYLRASNESNKTSYLRASNESNKTSYLPASNESNKTTEYIKPTSVISQKPVPTPMARNVKKRNEF